MGGSSLPGMGWAATGSEMHLHHAHTKASADHTCSGPGLPQPQVEARRQQ